MKDSIITHIVRAVKVLFRKGHSSAGVINRLPYSSMFNVDDAQQNTERVPKVKRSVYEN